MSVEERFEINEHNVDEVANLLFYYYKGVKLQEESTEEFLNSIDIDEVTEFIAANTKYDPNSRFVPYVSLRLSAKLEEWCKQQEELNKRGSHMKDKEEVNDRYMRSVVLRTSFIFFRIYEKYKEKFKGNVESFLSYYVTVAEVKRVINEHTAFHLPETLATKVTEKVEEQLRIALGGR